MRGLGSVERAALFIAPLFTVGVSDLGVMEMEQAWNRRKLLRACCLDLVNHEACLSWGNKRVPDQWNSLASSWTKQICPLEFVSLLTVYCIFGGRKWECMCTNCLSPPWIRWFWNWSLCLGEGSHFNGLYLRVSLRSSSWVSSYPFSRNQ